MIDGFFHIAFTGTAGSGFGVLVLREGNIAGVDVAGVVYDGTYKENLESGQIDLHVNVAAPAGVAPVQTGVPVATTVNYPIDATLVLEDLTSDNPILLPTPLGPVNMIIKKIRDFP